jgi:hypothetical protein
MYDDILQQRLAIGQTMVQSAWSPLWTVAVHQHMKVGIGQKYKHDRSHYGS